MPAIDSHCHLTATDFDADRAAVVARALQAGVQQLICIVDSLTEIDAAIELTKKYEQIFCTIGVHPHSAAEWNSQSTEVMSTLLAAHKKIVAIGEIGLDYHYNHAPKEVQKNVFLAQLQLAAQLQKPVVVHNRESWNDMWEIVEQIKPPQAVLHCCTEPWEHVQAWVEAGYMLSFTGMATFASATIIRDTIVQCPLTHMMIETDAPYLAPVPYRGKRCEPMHVLEVAKIIAEVKNVPLETVLDQTTQNALEFFNLKKL